MRSSLLLINKNVYYTNLLLIPIIILSFLIIEDYEKNIHPMNKNIWYIFPIYFSMFIFSIGFIFSSIYHYFYFNKDSSIFKQIGKIDYLVTAPLIGLITLTYYAIYFVFMQNSFCNNELEESTKPIFFTSVFFSLLGLTTYFYKKLLYGSNFKKVKDYNDKIKYLNMHTFFHYTIYTGIMLLYLLFYIENTNIYQCLFI